VTADLGTEPGLLVRLWSQPLRRHVGVVGLVLLALLPVVGASANMLADESAAVLQAHLLADGDGWTMPHPLPEGDPEQLAFPIHNATPGDDGYAPFAKHPTYSLMLAAQPFGTAGMVVLSTFATLLAGVLSALLARRVAPGLDRWSLWVVALGSPLLFDGYLVMAHSLGAAACAGAVLLVVEGRARSRAGLAALAALPLLAAVLLRNEAVLFALALALVLGVQVLRRRFRDRVDVVATAVAGGAAVLGYLLDRAFAAVVVPGAGVSQVVAGGGQPGFLSGRIESFAVTWVQPGYQIGGLTLLSLVVLVAASLCALSVRRHPSDRGPITVFAVVAAGAAVLRLALQPDLVPGLLAAFPLLLAALLLWRRDSLTGPAARLCAATAAVFALAVVATQYSSGGTGEWGGRYFALAIPVATPVLLDVVRAGGRRLEPTLQRRVLVAGVVLVVCTSLLAVATLREVHQRHADVVAQLLEDSAGVDPGDGGAPVVIASRPALLRLAWEHLDERRFLLVQDDDDLEGVLVAVEAAGVTDLTLVHDHDADADRSRLDDGLGPYEVVDEQRRGPTQVVQHLQAG
jgi:hypothetical protein